MDSVAVVNSLLQKTAAPDQTENAWLQKESSRGVKICYHSYKLIIFMTFALLFLIFIFIREIKNETTILDLLNRLYGNKTQSA